MTVSFYNWKLVPFDSLYAIDPFAPTSGSYLSVVYTCITGKEILTFLLFGGLAFMGEKGRGFCCLCSQVVLLFFHYIFSGFFSFVNFFFFFLLTVPLKSQAPSQTSWPPDLWGWDRRGGGDSQVQLSIKPGWKPVFPPTPKSGDQASPEAHQGFREITN